MLKRTLGIMSLIAVTLVIFVLAQSGSITLTGTVKFSDGTPVNGSDSYGVVYLTYVTEYYNDSGTIYANLSMSKAPINSTGNYKFDNLKNMDLYILQAFYVNISDSWFMSNKSYDHIVMNTTYVTYYNATYKVTFLNSSGDAAEYNLTVE